MRLTSRFSIFLGTNSSNRDFIVLDGLRGVAALAVLTRHAPMYFQSISTTSSGPFWESYLAVDFFFVLSGFILAHAYGSRLAAGMSPQRFMLIRLIRLYPLYFLALTIAIPISVSSEMKGISHGYDLVLNIILAVLFLPSPVSQGLFPLNGPAWSLFFELIANLWFAMSYRVLNSYLILVIVLVAGITLAAAVSYGALGFGAAFLVDGLKRGPLDYGMEWSSLGAGLARVAYSFFAGVLVYRVWKKIPAVRVDPFIVCSILIAILVSAPPREWQPVFDLFATMIGFPILIFVGASCVVGGYRARLFSLLGRASYALYVLQAPLYCVSLALVKRASVSVNGAIMP